MKAVTFTGLAPETGQEVCIVASHKSRSVVIRRLRSLDGMKAAFECADELDAWVGHGSLEQVVLKGGLTVWLTDTIRKCSEGRSWQEPAGKWIGYRWIHADPLVVELFNARLREVVNDERTKNEKAK